MAIKVGINGFGRIGRGVVRSILQRGLDIEVVHINDLAGASALAHLLKYDSVHRTLQQDVSHEDDAILLDGKKITVSAIRNPAEIPWASSQVDVVLECTGLFTKKVDAEAHMRAGAKKVIISAPGKEVDKTFVLGVNDSEYIPAEHHIVSNGSCTTNCLAPVTKVINEAFGIEKGLMTTVHAYTNDQKILDVPHKDMRRARAAAVSMIPTSTGAAKAIGEVIPELKGKLHGLAVRVPTPNVSLVDVVFTLKKETSAEDVNAALQKAAEGSLKGILGCSDLPLVSTDFIGNSNSSIVDLEYTTVMEGNMLKVLCWYDNEWGFSNRMAELAIKLMKA